MTKPKLLKHIYSIAGVCCLLLLAACGGSKPVDATKTDSLPEIFPDYIDVTIPAEIAPMNFNVTEPGTKEVYVAVRGEKGGEITVSGKWADFDIKDWHKLTDQNKGASLTFTVYAKVNGKWLQYNDFKMHVSQYPLDEWGVTYRRIAPGYEVYSSMGIYQRDLSNFKEYPIIENKQTSGQCYNCHTSNKTNPDQFVFHVRGNHGATMIQQGDQRKWLQAVNELLGGSMVYPYWHPSGKYCAFSTNQTRQGFHVGGEKRLEVFDNSSDVLVYDIAKNEIITDSVLSTINYSENTPVFSPDGKYLYFTTCLQKTYPLEFKDEKYNLCRIGFDEASGRFDGKVDTIYNAVAQGKSVTWPRPSYDGRFLLFTLSDYGYFSIWHKESDQWLLDLKTGEARPLDIVNSGDADSFHNWSANSRWIVFTSRRGDGLYTRLYIAAISPDGKEGKPFLMPQRNPLDYYDKTLYSFNTPDFTARKVEFDSSAAVDEILSDQRVPTKVKGH